MIFFSECSWLGEWMDWGSSSLEGTIAYARASPYDIEFISALFVSQRPLQQGSVHNWSARCKHKRTSFIEIRLDRL